MLEILRVASSFIAFVFVLTFFDGPCPPPVVVRKVRCCSGKKLFLTSVIVVEPETRVLLLRTSFGALAQIGASFGSTNREDIRGISVALYSGQLEFVSHLLVLIIGIHRAPEGRDIRARSSRANTSSSENDARNKIVVYGNRILCQINTRSHFKLPSKH